MTAEGGGLLHPSRLTEDEIVHDDHVAASFIVWTWLDIAADVLDLGDPGVIEHHTEERQAGVAG